MNNEDFAIIGYALKQTKSEAEQTIANASECMQLTQQQNLALISRKQLEFIETCLQNYTEKCELDDVDKVDKLSQKVHKMLHRTVSRQNKHPESDEDDVLERGPDDYTLQDLADKFLKWNWLEKHVEKLKKKIDKEERERKEQEAQQHMQ